ncbi:MAG: hypothetical protein GY833_22195 [Aestuariibacter sp.]|nr:hypothetical protein [Aestuariibacter sp.]|tara:strand:- start:28311 stop:28847 length:537 start_codon:yes stop_codon:yes gene_type:complete
MDNGNVMPVEGAPESQTRATMKEALELIRGADISGKAERFMMAQQPRDLYQLAKSIVDNHSQAVDTATRDYVRKYAPEHCTTVNDTEAVLDAVAESIEYSWITGKVDDPIPKCHVRSHLNPNWEPLYLFGIQMLPIEHAVEHGLSPYTVEDIPAYKERHGNLTLCLYCDSLVESPKLH